MPADYTSPAFPIVVPEDQEVSGFKGLTKREYFAAHAMAALITRPELRYKSHVHLVDEAFKIASAMTVRANVRE